jgi:hypothetical protein
MRDAGLAPAPGGRTVSYASTDLVVLDGYGYHGYRYTWELAPRRGGAPAVAQGEGIHILRRQPDGSWRIAREMWNEAIPVASSGKARGRPREG